MTSDSDDPKANSIRKIETWMASSAAARDEIAREMVADIGAGNLTLLVLVQHLGPHLTSEDDDIRTKGVEFLSSVLHQCEAANVRLNRQTTHALITFYCGKLSDTETIVPALHGLVALCKQESCLHGEALQVTNALFTEVKMRALVQSVRYDVFTIIDILLSRHRTALKDMGSAFLSGYTGLAEGEKDPRNLLLTFAIDKVLLVEFEVSNHIEAFYNITFCYFPISFRPPPNDPCGITAEDLKVKLRDCLSATPEFGALAIPLFLEKLTSGSPITKQDTLDALKVCLPIYGASVAHKHAQSLWNSVKLEIFQPVDQMVETLALEVVKVLVTTLGEELLPMINTDCIQLLEEPGKSEARASMKILHSLASEKNSASDIIFKGAVSRLLEVFNDPVKSMDHPQLILFMCRLLDAQQGASNFVDFKDQLINMLSSGLSSPGSCQEALALLQVLLTVPSLLSDEEASYFMQQTTKEYLEPRIETDGYDKKILVFWSSLNNHHYLSNFVLPTLFSHLPDKAPDQSSEDLKTIKHVLTALGKICIPGELFRELYVHLSKKLELVWFSKDVEQDTANSCAYGYALLKAISIPLHTKLSENHADIPQHGQVLLPQLYQWFIYSATSNTHQHLAMEPSTVKLASNIITMLIQPMSAQQQRVILDLVYNAFFNGMVDKFTHGYLLISADVTFAPFEMSHTHNNAHKSVVPLAMACFYALYPEVSIPTTSLHDLIYQLLSWIVCTPGLDENVADSVSHGVASLLNKYETSSDILDSLNKFWTNCIISPGLAPDSQRAAITAWVWVIKGLLCKNHPSSFHLAMQLFSLFDSTDSAKSAAWGIGQVLQSDSVLTKANHFKIKGLHQQKYVCMVLPHIYDGIRTTTEPRHGAYIISLASIVQFASCSTYETEISKLIPLLLQVVDSLDNELQMGIITALHAVSSSKSSGDLLTQHSSTVIEKVLCCITSSNSSLKVRCLALQYLAMLPQVLPYTVLHPEKGTVMQSLTLALDDPKLKIRKATVYAYTRWLHCHG